nr:putative mitochondrial protein [Tanacetum cinerariifolium]
MGARLRSVENSLAQVTRALQELNQRMQGRPQNQNQFTRMTKVKFPKFLGDDVKWWIFRLNGEVVSWNVYKKGILQRFGTVFDDLISEIRKIKYQSNAKEYQDAFDTLLSRVDVSEEHVVSFYLGSEIEMGVRMFKPTTLLDAYQLTNYQEATLEAMRKKNKAAMNSQQRRVGENGSGYGSKVKTPLLPLPSPTANWKTKPNTPATVPVRKRMTQKEYQEKRAQNLCFYCDQNKSLEDHVQHLSVVLATTRQNQLFTKKSKCVFGTNQVEYLGHVISAKEVATDPTKINAMQEWPIPSNVKQLRGFLGLTRHFVIKTGHFSLKYLFNQKITTPTQMKCLPKLLGFDYEVVYKKGSDNAAINALSRVQTSELFSMVTTLVSTDLAKKIEASWLADDKLQAIITKLQASQIARKHYVWSNSQLTRKGKIIVGNDPELRKKLLQYFHRGVVRGHSGTTPFETVYGIPPPIHVPYLGGLNRKLAAQPLKVLGRKMVKKKNVVAVYGLIQWTNGNVDDATWEPLDKLSKDYPAFDLNS